MRVEKNPDFNNKLFTILKHISINNPKNAIRFKKELDSKILELPNMPYRCRASIYYDDTDVRDLIFKGYTVPYLIDNERSKLVVLEIFKWTDR
jgi:toxin ParE1/3/4